jgi:hypothetical protein
MLPDGPPFKMPEAVLLGHPEKLRVFPLRISKRGGVGTLSVYMRVRADVAFTTSPPEGVSLQGKVVERWEVLCFRNSSVFNPNASHLFHYLQEHPEEAVRKAELVELGRGKVAGD